MSSLCRFVPLTLLVACAATNFDSQTILQSVRFLGTRIDKPYARPSDRVTLETLAIDARIDRSSPMKVFWIPVPCINPQRDLYYMCFSQLSGKSGGSSLGPLPPDGDITALLPTGNTFSMTLPSDIITTHPVVAGAVDPYGMAVVFNIACTGRVKVVAAESASPQAPPLGCFDNAGNRLGADDYVIGLTRVYAYDTRTNANPVIDALLVQGQPVSSDKLLFAQPSDPAPTDPPLDDTAFGIVVDRCTEGKRGGCPEIAMDVTVPASSQEWNPGDLDKNGNPQREQLWASYYATSGDFGSDARLLYEPSQGKISDSANKYRANQTPGDGIVWVVVHDNRGGTQWVGTRVRVR
ncbi:MAG: hypothetical protein WCI05_17855 [Myxococcales bacterium]